MPRYQRGRAPRTTNRAPVVTRLTNHIIESYTSIDDFPLISQSQQQHASNQTKKRPRTTTNQQNPSNSQHTTQNLSNFQQNSNPTTPLSPTSSSLGGKLPPDASLLPRKCQMCLTNSLQTHIISCSLCTFTAHIFCLDPILPKLLPDWICTACQHKPTKWKQQASFQSYNILNKYKDQFTHQFLFHVVRSLELETDLLISSQSTTQRQNNNNTTVHNNNHHHQNLPAPIPTLLNNNHNQQSIKQNHQQTKEDPTALQTITENNPEHTSHNTVHQHQTKSNYKSSIQNQKQSTTSKQQESTQPPKIPTRRSFPRAAKSKAARAVRQGPNTRSAATRQRENAATVVPKTIATDNDNINQDQSKILNQKRLKKSQQIIDKVKSSQKEEREQSTDQLLVDKNDSQTNHSKRKKSQTEDEQQNEPSSPQKKKTKLDISVDADGSFTRKLSSENDEITSALVPEVNRRITRQASRNLKRLASEHSELESGAKDSERESQQPSVSEIPVEEEQHETGSPLHQNVKHSPKIKISTDSDINASIEKTDKSPFPPKNNDMKLQEAMDNDKTKENIVQAEKPLKSTEESSSKCSNEKITQATNKVSLISQDQNQNQTTEPKNSAVTEQVGVAQNAQAHETNEQQNNANNNVHSSETAATNKNQSIPTNTSRLPSTPLAKRHTPTTPLTDLTMDPKHQALLRFAAVQKQRPKQTDRDRARQTTRFSDMNALEKATKLKQRDEGVPQSELQRIHVTSLVVSARQRNLESDSAPPVTENKYSKASIQSLLGDKDDNNNIAEKQDFPSRATPLAPLSTPLSMTLAQRLMNPDVNRTGEQSQSASYPAKCGIMRQTNTANGTVWQYVNEGPERRRTRTEARNDNESLSKEVEVVSVTRSADPRPLPNTSGSSWGNRSGQDIDQGSIGRSVADLSPIQTIRKTQKRPNVGPAMGGSISNSEGPCLPAARTSNLHNDRREQNSHPARNGPIIINLDGPDSIQPINQAQPSRPLLNDHVIPPSSQPYNTKDRNRFQRQPNAKYPFDQDEHLLSYNNQSNIGYDNRLRDVDAKHGYLELNRDPHSIPNPGIDLARDVDPTLRPARKSTALYLPTAQRRAQYERGRALAMIDRGEAQAPMDAGSRRLPMSRNNSYGEIHKYGQENRRFQPPLHSFNSGNSLKLLTVGSYGDRDRNYRISGESGGYKEVGTTDFARPAGLVTNIRPTSQNMGLEKTYDIARGPSAIGDLIGRKNNNRSYNSVIGREYPGSMANGGSVRLSGSHQDRPIQSSGVNDMRYNRSDSSLDRRLGSTSKANIGGQNDAKERKKLEAMQPPVPTMLRPTAQASIPGLEHGDLWREFGAQTLGGTPLHRQIPKPHPPKSSIETKKIGNAVGGMNNNIGGYGLPTDERESKGNEPNSQGSGMVLQLCHPPPVQPKSSSNEGEDLNDNGNVYGQSHLRRQTNPRGELPPISSLPSFRSAFGSNRR